MSAARAIPPGRPRKSSDDATSKRRAQVREAQKAYRSRQQSQVSSLKTRVEQLENVLDNLGQSMHAFDVQVIQGGSQWPQPRLLRAVKMLCEDIASQFKRAGNGAYDTTGFQKEEPPQTTNEHTQLQTTQRPLATRESHPSQFWKLFMGSSTAMMPSGTPHSPNLGHNMIQFPSTANFGTDAIQYATTPFTQRLFRACAESGLRFLSNPSFQVADMWPEFGLLLQKLPRVEIRDYFTRVVSMQPCNPVVDSRFPYISLGGSGTHFLTPSDEPPGVFALFEATNGLYHVASDEEWFDVHDVERYLFNQGIAIGEFPSSASSVHSLDDQDGLSPSLALIQGASQSNMMMVVDEYKLINRLCQLPVGLGCVAGFRRSDIERVVSINVRWAPVGAPG